jgi:hypothetical protein
MKVHYCLHQHTNIQHWFTAPKCTQFVIVLRNMTGCFMGTKQKYQDALYLTSCFIYFSPSLRKWLILWLVSQIHRHNEWVPIKLLYTPTLVYTQKPTPNISLYTQTQTHLTLSIPSLHILRICPHIWPLPNWVLHSASSSSIQYFSSLIYLFSAYCICWELDFSLTMEQIVYDIRQKQRRN